MRCFSLSFTTYGKGWVSSDTAKLEEVSYTL